MLEKLLFYEGRDRVSKSCESRLFSNKISQNERSKETRSVFVVIKFCKSQDLEKLSLKSNLRVDGELYVKSGFNAKKSQKKLS
jgi:hypothetical protein